jgi:hypothetical protein
MELDNEAAAEAWGQQEQDHACQLAVEGLYDSADEATKLSAIHQVRELCLPQHPFCVQNRTQVGALGGIELMAALLDSRSGDVQRQACLALNEACLKNTANSNQLCHCGAIRAIMDILCSGNPDLQTQALAVLGTSAVNSLEVRFALRDCGAIAQLVRLLGAKTTSVQEWAAYALRKACSRSSNLQVSPSSRSCMSLSPARPRGRPLLYRLPAAPLSSVAWRCASSVRLSQLSTSMIDIAKQAGAVRELIKMFELRSKDAVDEAQQTLDYFGVDDAAVKSIREQMDREASTQPLVRLQKLSWVMGAHERLGVSSANRALAGDLVERIGRYIAAAARPAVVFRWETQGLAWVQPLDWQRRAFIAEASAARQVRACSSTSASGGPGPR